MTRFHGLLVSILAATSLGGCAASLAASAASMAVRSAQPKAQSNAHLKPVAVDACTQQARTHGAVHIIDVEQRSVGRMIVWGTVTDATARRSFQCHFTDRIADFKVRDIRPRP